MKVLIPDLSFLSHSHAPESQTGADSQFRCDSSFLGNPAALPQREKQNVWMVLSNPVMLVSEILAGLLFFLQPGIWIT